MGDDELSDGCLQFLNTSVRTALDLPQCKECEPTLNLVKPRSMGGSKVQMVARPLLQPPADDMQPQENFMRKYYTDQAWLDKERIVHQTPPEAHQKNMQAWQQLFAEIEAAIDLDSASAPAQALTKRWLRLAETANGGNEAIRTGSIEAWKDRHNWPQDQQDKLLASFGLDPQDRTASMKRVETVTKFIGRTIGRKVQSNLRALYERDPS